MTYLEFYLRAKTPFFLHSPFMFALHQKVLFAPLNKNRRRELDIHSREEELLYKLSDYLHPQNIYTIDIETPVAATQPWNNQEPQPHDIIFVNHPHRTSASGKQWSTLCQHPDATATIDTFHAGIILFDKKLSKQHFLLRP